jgi:hypothetical protein
MTLYGNQAKQISLTTMSNLEEQQGSESAMVHSEVLLLHYFDVTETGIL